MQKNKVIHGDNNNIDLKHGNCLELMEYIPDRSIDMVFADLPYNITASKWDKLIPLESLWDQYKRVVKDNSAIIFTASQPFTSKLVMSNPKMFKHEWIWEKNRGSNFGCVRFQPMKEHESILVFGKNKIKYNPIKESRKGSGENRIKYDVIARTQTENYASSLHNETKLNCSKLRYPSSIQKFNTPTGKEKFNHPTQKPVALIEYLIKTYTNENDIILDNVMGSGTTGIACINTNRSFVGIEKDEKYFEIARKRLEDWSKNSSNNDSQQTLF